MRGKTLIVLAALALMGCRGGDRYEMVAADRGAYRLDKKTGEVRYYRGMRSWPVEDLPAPPEPPPTSDNPFSGILTSELGN